MSTATQAPANGAIQKSTNGGTLGRPTAAGGRLQGADQEDLILPRIHIFQGLPAEVKQYGKEFSQGDLVNTLTGEKVEARKFTPIYGYKEWICWKEPRGAGIEYRHKSDEKHLVPAEDLLWSGDEPPRAQVYINWIVLFEGTDIPMVLSFTKTGMNAGKTINTLEKLRGKKGPGMYSIEMKEKSNDKGTWVSPQIRPAGDPPAEMTAVSTGLYESMSGVTVQVDLGDGAFDPDSE